MDRIAAAAQGDALARDWLVRTYTPAIYRCCLAMLKEEGAARDATQDSLIKALRALQSFDGRGRFQGWLLTIARNTCRSEFRRRRVHATPMGEDFTDTIADPRPGPDPIERLHSEQVADRMHLALDSLPPAYREVIELYHYQNLKYREIADVLALPMGTVMNRIFRARRKLKDAWEALEAADASEVTQARSTGSPA